MFELAASTIFATLAGSQAQQTAQEGSDVDVRGVCVAPLSLRVSLFEHFEQYDGPLDAELSARLLPGIQAHPTAAGGIAAGVECVIFELAKFLKLCAAANPNALEILFADERDWLLETPAWRRLYGERHHFLTRRVHQSYLGYATAQLNKIELQRAAPQNRKSARNPARAALERRFGYDTKHAMHLIRLMRMGLEILQGQGVLVRRPDAEELNAIRDGALSHDELIARAAELRARMAEAAATSALPADVDRARVDALAFELIQLC